MVARSDFTDLTRRDIFQGSNRDLLASLGHHIDNRDDAVVFLAAVAGSKKYQDRLRVTQTNVFAGLQKATGQVNPYEARTLNHITGAYTPAILPNMLQKDINAEMVIADLIKRDKGLRDAIAAVGEQPFGLLERAGSRSTEARKIADAWRLGRDARKSLIKREVRDEARLGTGPAAYERIFQLSAMTPRVRVWEWLGGYHPSGYIDIRGWNSGKATDELTAATYDGVTLGLGQQRLKPESVVRHRLAEFTLCTIGQHHDPQNILGRTGHFSGYFGRFGLRRFAWPRVRRRLHR
jgi:hypothetical protein